MSATLVVHVKDPDGYDVYMGRGGGRTRLAPSVWRNPWQIGKSHPDTGDPMTRDDVIELFEMRTIPALRAQLARMGTGPFLDGQLLALQGQRLGCHCARPGHPLTAADPWICHAQVVAAMADALVV